MKIKYQKGSDFFISTFCSSCWNQNLIKTNFRTPVTEPQTTNVQILSSRHLLSRSGICKWIVLSPCLHSAHINSDGYWGSRKLRANEMILNLQISPISRFKWHFPLCLVCAFSICFFSVLSYHSWLIYPSVIVNRFWFLFLHLFCSFCRRV